MYLRPTFYENEGKMKKKIVYKSIKHYTTIGPIGLYCILGFLLKYHSTADFQWSLLKNDPYTYPGDTYTVNAKMVG